MAAFLELIPIDHPPFFQDPEESSPQQLSQELQDMPTGTPILLKTARPFLGNLWLPTYLPAGFDIDLAEVTNTNREHPDLIFPIQSAEEEKQGQIIMTVHRAEAYQHEYVPIDYESFVMPVDMDGRDGIMIKGGWLIELDEDGAVRHSGWSDKHTRRLVVRDSRRAQVITLDVVPASLVTEEELVGIAASLHVSSVYRSWLPWLNRG
ncbi:MAG: hypothetical protein KDD84_05150 [Caldilineaceae bacterium]|nr:hypothetical protein [Caldilineaceae bacterium]